MFFRLNFQTSTGDITHADLFKEGNTKKQRLAARGNILANKDLQHFLVLAFQHLHVLPLLFEVQLSTNQRAAVQLLDCIWIATGIAICAGLRIRLAFRPPPHAFLPRFYLEPLVQLIHRSSASSRFPQKMPLDVQTSRAELR